MGLLFTYENVSIVSRNPFAKHTLHGFLPVTGIE